MSSAVKALPPPERFSGARIAPPAGGAMFVVAIAALVGSLGFWASLGTLDTYASGQGRVVPSLQIQRIQNLEGGILSQLLVADGDRVAEGQILARIDDVAFASEFQQNRQKYLSLLAAFARLEAESAMRPAPDFPAEALGEGRIFVDTERTLFQARRQELDAARETLGRNLVQRQQELRTLIDREQWLARSLELSNRELEIVREVAERGYRSQLDLLRLQRQSNEIEGQLRTTRLQIPGVRAAAAEVEARLEERQRLYQREASTELARVRAELSATSEILRSMADRVARREVRSPVAGTVKQIAVRTIGGVLEPGAALMEIVPGEDELLVEARIRPNDIAFVHPGQTALLKISAYDFSIYGGIKGEVARISADSIPDDKGEPWFHVRVRADRMALGTPERPLPISPGMTAQVDIVTGQRTILQYLLKPIVKTTDRAMTER
ncbi:MAG: HlyD family type I secretion periplasmic adaptor subunit [Azospirillum sp.]|nr:HlyD family type I secretion periplasmic adaptor subunit [Azospirillum sp.]MCZ8124867.1 HlyD family type I secretion periplasmic adaptor subunit [Magnetospirillum sp.]